MFAARGIWKRNSCRERMNGAVKIEEPEADGIEGCHVSSHEGFGCFNWGELISHQFVHFSEQLDDGRGTRRARLTSWTGGASKQPMTKMGKWELMGRRRGRASKSADTSRECDLWICWDSKDGGGWECWRWRIRNQIQEESRYFSYFRCSKG